jgi:hypothetical protein
MCSSAQTRKTATETDHGLVRPPEEEAEHQIANEFVRIGGSVTDKSAEASNMKPTGRAQVADDRLQAL